MTIADSGGEFAEDGIGAITPLTSASISTGVGGVHSIACTQSMRWVLSGGGDGLIRKYDFFASIKATPPQSGGHAGMADSLSTAILLGSWDNEEQQSAAAASAASADHHSNNTASHSHHMHHGKSPVYALAVHSEAVWALSGSNNGSINLWTVRHDQGHCAHTFQPPTGAASKSPQIGVLRVMPGERSFLSGSWDSAVSLWDLDDGRLIRQFNGPHNAPITSIEVSFAASQQLIMTASLDGVLALWDGRVGGGAAAAHIIPPGQSPPWCLSACLSPDGQSVYCGRRDGHIERFDLRNLPAASAAPAQILKAPPNAGPVTAVYCVPGGDGLLVSANTDCLRLWSTRLAGAESSSSSSSSSCRVIRGHPGGGPVSAIHVDPQRLFMVTSSGSRGLSATTTAAATTATATTADSSQLMFYSITA